jgi:hypothetical protein
MQPWAHIGLMGDKIFGSFGSEFTDSRLTLGLHYAP